jgi:hypothetical protein
VFVFVSRYMLAVGILEHLPMGSSYIMMHEYIVIVSSQLERVLTVNLGEKLRARGRV